MLSGMGRESETMICERCNPPRRLNPSTYDKTCFCDDYPKEEHGWCYCCATGQVVRND